MKQVSNHQDNWTIHLEYVLRSNIISFVGEDLHPPPYAQWSYGGKKSGEPL